MIELIDLTKKYDKFTAVDHLNVEIKTGEFLGLLGPNSCLAVIHLDIDVDDEGIYFPRSFFEEKLEIIVDKLFG